MLAGCEIECKNNFLRLTLEHILASIKQGLEERPQQKLRMLVIYEHSIGDEWHHFKTVDLSGYDVVLCSSFFHMIVSKFTRNTHVKFISLDSTYAGLKKGLVQYLRRQKIDERRCNRNTHFLIPYSSSEISFVNDVLAQMDIKQLAEKYNCADKTIYAHRRSLMKKIGCSTNYEFLVSVYFLKYLKRNFPPQKKFQEKLNCYIQL